MLTVLKTAIVTITISFISGVLLDTYKNYAPRILCTMGKGIPIRLNNKRIKAYILSVKNASNKTLHNLTLCIQETDAQNNLKIDEAKITGGLKFDISNEEDDYNVNIPFLSKNDEFTVKLFVENHHGDNHKPIITLRSPENFKRIDRSEKKGLSGLLSSITQSVGSSSNHKNNYEGERYNSENRFLKKKALITTGVVILALCAGVFGIEYYNSIIKQSQSSNEKTINNNETDHSKTSANMSSNNSNLNQSTNTNKNKSSALKEPTEEIESNSGIKDSSSVQDNAAKSQNNKATENIQKDQDKEKSDNSADEEDKETNKSNTEEKSETVVKNESPDKGASTEKINQQLDSDNKSSSQNTKVNEEKKTVVDSQSTPADKGMVQKNNSPDSQTGNK